MLFPGGPGLGWRSRDRICTSKSRQRYLLLFRQSHILLLLLFFFFFEGQRSTFGQMCFFQEIQALGDVVEIVSELISPTKDACYNFFGHTFFYLFFFCFLVFGIKIYFWTITLLPLTPGFGCFSIDLMSWNSPNSTEFTVTKTFLRGKMY